MAPGRTSLYIRSSILACLLAGAPAAVAGDSPPVEVILGVIGRPEPAWWTRALDQRVIADLQAQAPNDTLPWEAVGAAGLPTTLEIVLAVPDSLVAARLWELKQEDEVGCADPFGYFRAVSRARAGQDLKSREAAMFGEFNNETIVVPNPDDD
jgi:hypothetical protein